MGGLRAGDEIPLLLISIYLFRYMESHHSVVFVSRIKRRLAGRDLRERHSQVGSLAGAAHLLNDNTGVLRGAQ